MMSITEIIINLAAMGISLRVTDDDRLEVIAPEGALTPELKKGIESRKRAIIENRKRLRFLIETLDGAMRATDAKFGGRLVWDRDKPEAKAAGEAVDQAMYNYVEGTGTLDDVQEAWQAYIRALDSQYETGSQSGNLRLVL